MIYRVTARLSAEHPYLTVVWFLENTSYKVYKEGGVTFASYDFSYINDGHVNEVWRQKQMHKIEDDLLNLGLMTDSTYIVEVV